MNKTIVEFIENFRNHGAKTPVQEEALRVTFEAGYCYYFAHMLKLAFKKGEVCICAPFGHFVYVEDGVPYDFHGVSDAEYECLIPESYLGDTVLDFMHIPGVSHNTTVAEIDSIMRAYKNKTAFTLKDLEASPDLLIPLMEHCADYKGWFEASFPNGASSAEEVKDRFERELAAL